MRTLRVTLSYDGTDFEGWQLQPERRTVQGAVEEALAALCGRPLRPNAAGRTDSGVHAAAQVLSLNLPDEVTLPLRAFVHGLNKHLPPDVAVLSAEEVEEGFDARFDASGKMLSAIRFPAAAPTMPCFGGPDLKTLFVTSLRGAAAADDLDGSVFFTRVETCGVPIPRFSA